jgi:hypothetical protein
MEPIGSKTKFNAFIIAKGDVIYSPGDIFEARCPTDISKFPFDEQQCSFTHALQIQRVARKQVDSREQTTQLVQLP